jgi:hypothetical protein
MARVRATNSTMGGTDHLDAVHHLAETSLDLRVDHVLSLMAVSPSG